MGELLCYIGRAMCPAGTETVTLLDTSFIECGEHRLRVARMGKGPAIIFLHGYPDNLQIWSQLAPLLSERFETIAFDWPGTGYSDEWPGGATPSHMADRIKTIMDVLRIEKATLVGHDMGGQPAFVFADKYSERIDKLVVMNCLAFGDEPTSWDIALLRQFGLNRLALQRFPQVVFRRAVSTFLPAGVRISKELHEELWATFKQPNVRAFISKMCAGYQGTLDKLPSSYQRIRCSTLILWAEKDKHFPLNQARRLHSEISGSTLEIISGAEHWMMLYKQTEVAECLRKFLDRV